MPQVMSGQDIERAVRRIAHEILERHHGADSVVIVGIHTRGVHLARLLGDLIEEFEGVEVPVGQLDIGAYRDDRDIRGDDGHLRRAPSAPSTQIPADISEQSVIVVDDVLYTGRTVRAALDALSDVGRARQTELAVLVDRGHRQLPIRADYVGKNLPTSNDEVVRVRIPPVDSVRGVWVERNGAA